MRSVYTVRQALIDLPLRTFAGVPWCLYSGQGHTADRSLITTLWTEAFSVKNTRHLLLWDFTVDCTVTASHPNVIRDVALKWRSTQFDGFHWLVLWLSQFDGISVACIVGSPTA